MEKLIEALMSQAPEVYEQFLFMSRAENVGWFVVCLTIASLCLFGLKKAKTFDEEPAMATFLACGVFGALAALGLFCNAVDFAVSFRSPKAAAIREMLHHTNH